MRRYTEANRADWNERVPIHVRSAFYDVEAFKAGRSTLNLIERGEVGDVSGRSLLHLQCHFGLDTLSWARLGARATGVDFSEKAIALARTLSDELGISAAFICADIYDLPQHLKETFDLVYTSRGVLCWLPDMPRWAEIVARFLRPGGTFYLFEDHPFAGVFENERDTTDLKLAYGYFHRPDPLRFEPGGSYADPTATLTTPTYEWQHSLADVLNALTGAGLRVEFLHEFPICSWSRFPFMERSEDGWWRLPERFPPLPLTFSLKALK
ncbi:MAG: class I SAM-dependent methyltransferase [bacterium]